jgi:outer membrane lipoprotein SlyB
VSVHRQRLTPWIIGTVVLCAALGAWFGRHVGDGRGGYVALISAACAVIGSFFPGAVLWLRSRLRDHGKPHRGAA